MVLLSLAKYGESPGDGREVVTLVKLHEQYMSSFQAESGGTDPLGEFVRSLGDDWFDFITKNNILTKLYRVYEFYFPREVAGLAHVKFDMHVADQSRAISHAHRAMFQILKDYDIVKVHDFRSIANACVRDSERTAVPHKFQELLNVQPPGCFFTFHKFILTIQKIADYRHKGETHVQKLAQFLHCMDQCKPPWQKGHNDTNFLPPGFVTYAEVETKKDAKGTLLPHISDAAGRVFEWYITLGEPLTRSKMSYAKFVRFLRDAGIVKADHMSDARSQMSEASEATGVTAKSSMPSPCRPGKEVPLTVLSEPFMTCIDAHIIYAAHARKNNGHFYFEDFLDACIEISNRVYSKKRGVVDDGDKDDVKYMGKFSSDFFDGLIFTLVDVKQLITSSHVPFLDKADGEELADILALAYDGLDKIFHAYLRSTDAVKYKEGEVAASGGMFDASIEAWSLRDWNKFIREFKIHRVTKTLPLNRVFYVYAVPINNCCYLDSTDAFVDSIVLVAERMIIADKLDSSRDRLVWLLHHMHSIAPITLVAHLRPLFPGLPDRPDHRPKQKVPTGWRSVLKTLSESEGKTGKALTRSKAREMVEVPLEEESGRRRSKLGKQASRQVTKYTVPR
jgi:hypothetical protein